MSGRAGCPFFHVRPILSDVEENEAVTTEAEALADILAWSQDRPLWQRDALCRLTEAEELSAAPESMPSRNAVNVALWLGAEVLANTL